MKSSKLLGLVNWGLVLIGCFCAAYVFSEIRLYRTSSAQDGRDILALVEAAPGRKAPPAQLERVSPAEAASVSQPAPDLELPSEPPVAVPQISVGAQSQPSLGSNTRTAPVLPRTGRRPKAVSAAQSLESSQPGTTAPDEPQRSASTGGETGNSKSRDPLPVYVIEVKPGVNRIVDPRQPQQPRGSENRPDPQKSLNSLKSF